MQDTQTDAHELTAVVTSAEPPLQKGWPVVQLMRPKQWVKNGFVLAPLIFSGEFLLAGAVFNALFATALFCVASSAVYIVNDLQDIEKDRQHPKKRFSRPLAAGTITPRQAKLVLVALYGLVAVSAFFSLPLAAVLASYIGLNVAYTFKLKAIPVVDLFCVASGFVMRVLAGATALTVPLSNWMLITTLCLALYLATIKRRQELAASGADSRSVLAQYTLPLLDRYAEMASIAAIIFYGLFVTTARPALAVTIPFILFGMFRYWFIVERQGGGESPTDALWNDRPLAVTVLAWAMVSAIALVPR